MFINNSQKNWDMFRNAVHHADAIARKNGKPSVVTRTETTTADLLREVERVVKAEPSEGNFTPLILGNLMAYELTRIVVDTTLAIVQKRQLNNSDIADIAATVASDYTISLANLAYQKVEAKMIEHQIEEITA